MAFIPDKPGHRRFAFRNLNSTQYKTYAHKYSKAKAGGIRCVYGWMSVAEVLGIVINYGKRKFATVCINAVAYILSLAIVVFTNASRIVTVSKSVPSSAAFCFESGRLNKFSFFPNRLSVIWSTNSNQCFKSFQFVY